MRAKRFIALLAIAGTLTVLVVAILGASGERAQQAQAQAPGTETLEFVNSDPVRQGLFPGMWQITPAINPTSASLDTAPYRHEHTWDMPRTIPPGGAQATITVKAEDKSGGRIYASTVLFGYINVDGAASGAEVFANADKVAGQPTASATKTVTLTPRGGSDENGMVLVTIRILDGPDIKFNYRVVTTPAPTPTPTPVPTPTAAPAAPPAGDPTSQSDNRPARVRRVRSCPARNRSSARAAAAAAAKCVWYVSFEVEQRGLPWYPKTLSDELAAIETVGSGAVYFNRKPRQGVFATGSAAGVFGVRHDYISQALAQWGYDTSLEVGGKAVYRYRSPGLRELAVNYLLTSTTRPECPTAAYLGTKTYGLGETFIGLRDDLSPDNSDRLEVLGGGALCELRGNFRPSSTNRLRVKIGKPRLVRR